MLGIKRFKGQSQIIGVVLLTLVMITMIGITYMWGMPLIEKQKDVVRVSNVERFMKELDNKIQNVAKNGGTQRIDNPNIPGELKIIDYGTNDRIELIVQTTGTDMATEMDIYLKGDDNDEVSIGNEPSVLKVISNELGDNAYSVNMTLYYRNLTGSKNVYIIDLLSLGRDVISGDGHRIVISEGDHVPMMQEGERAVYTTIINVRFE
ncbi:MAG: hypothetical protein KAT37_01685 [Candidatus Aenigmarchaeota archaeon]|nr:hypothetical protein [Candidatus Aenigmarchaeota archaeon]